jgi:predicted ATP-dependent endonuclease of OLD family
MYVEKIEIPAFRVLRNVVLDFSGGYEPQIFPIGSENGGGKSTLLQLVFALLHCSAEPSRHEYLENLLASDSHVGGDERLIAQITIEIDDESHALEFVSLNNLFLEHKLETPPQLGFNIWREGYDPFKAQQTTRERIDQLSLRKKLDEMDERELADLQKQLGDIDLRVADVERISGLLVALDYEPIMTYRCPTPKEEIRALVCRIPGQRASKAQDVLRAAASKVFLLGPSSQQYLFLDKEARKALLTATPLVAGNGNRAPRNRTPRPRPQIEYLTKLDESERTMPGFFAYDWLSVEPLVQLFASARDEDFKGAVKTGTYGNSYATILKEVNAQLLGKQVRPLEDLSGVEFIVTSPGGEETKLSPEDLSQGELKRLMIYAWLKANRAVDSLVLIDEIEASLHPDWQLGIVHDLQTWAPNNQYLLATHSYDLCRALTPRHVRDLSPALPWKGAVETETEAGEPSDG